MVCRGWSMVIATLSRRRRSAASTADGHVAHLSPCTRDLTRLTSVTVPAAAGASECPAPLHAVRSTMLSPNEDPTSHTAGRRLNESRPVMLAAPALLRDDDRTGCVERRDALVAVEHGLLGWREV